jgi:hypothetical protein
MSLITILALVGCVVVAAAHLAAVYVIAQERDARKRRE